MTLKNLFDMVKADRYTADGREALIKAQEAETEDKVYQIGEISQKTGLQKTANGWIKPKNEKQPGKTDKPNPNGVVAQQKQKLEAEKYEAARRDAQAPSKKTEVNTPGLRKDVQEAIKRSTPEEIKAYIKELRTPGSRMSRYFDNPDLLANVYEDELNKMTESKPAAGKITSRADKEAAIRKDLGLRGENDLDRFTDEQIESMYQKTQKTPEQQKADFDKSKIGQAVNKGRQEFAAEKTRQKELASKTNAIGLPKENKTAESKPTSTATEKKSASTQEFIKIPTARGYAKVPKEAYSKYANNKANVRLSDYIGRKMAGKPSNESNKFYDFVQKKIYESGEDPKPYLGQGGYSYPQSLIDMYYDEWESKTTDAAPRQLTGDTRIRVRKA